MKKSEYAMLDPTATSFTPKPSDQKESGTNPLPCEDEVIEGEEGALDDIESYEPTQEMDFEVDEVKDCLEKKKKRRNYLEFRPGYDED
jgi:hypothetical protein